MKKHYGPDYPAGFKPRYDPDKGIYRDCKWCHGKGCLACPGEAAKEYEATGPKLVGTFPNTPEGVDAAMKLVMSLLPKDRLPVTKETP